MDLHPLIVHFPIALLITGFVFATVELVLKKECKCKFGFTIEPFTIQKTAYYLLILGSLSAVVAVLSGFIFTSDMEGKLDRYAYNMKYNSVLETGGLVIGQEVRLNASVELTKVEK
jgi:uncharacterized membrane protein